MPISRPKAGTVIAATVNALTLLTAPWAALMTGAIAFGLASFKTTRDFLFSPGFAVGAGVWLTLWWTYVAVRILGAQSIVKSVVLAWDCAYCVNVETTEFRFDVTNPECAFQTVFGIRNLGNGPIRFKLEEFKLQIADRVSQDNALNETVIPRISPKGVISGHLKLDALPETGDIIFSFKAIYGRHDGEFERRFTVRGGIHYRITGSVFNGALGVKDQSDEAI